MAPGVNVIKLMNFRSKLVFFPGKLTQVKDRLG